MSNLNPFGLPQGSTSSDHSFIHAGQNRFTRKWGTEYGNVVNPLISGHFGVKFDITSDAFRLVADLARRTNKNLNGLTENSIPPLLESITRSVTIPGKTLNSTEITGIGGIKFVVPTTIEIDNNITVKFLELENNPVTTIFSTWCRLIKDSKTGASNLRGDWYSKEKYSTNLLYYTTKPDLVSIQYAAFYAGVWPKKDPADMHSFDLEAADRVEIDMDFAYDYVFEDRWVYDIAARDAMTKNNELAGTMSGYESQVRNI